MVWQGLGWASNSLYINIGIFDIEFSDTKYYYEEVDSYKGIRVFCGAFA